MTKSSFFESAMLIVQKPYGDPSGAYYYIDATIIAYDRYNFDGKPFEFKGIKIDTKWNGLLVQIGLAHFFHSFGTMHILYCFDADKY